MVEGCSVFTMYVFVYITRLYNGSVISRAREAEFSLVQVTNKDSTKNHNCLVLSGYIIHCQTRNTQIKQTH